MDIWEDTVLTLFLQAIPEMIAFSLLVVVITKDLKNWKKAVLVGVILVVALHFIRMVPDVVFGVHTIIFMCLAVILYRLVLNVHVAKIIVAMILGLLVIFAGEALTFLVIIGFTGLSIDEIMSDTYWRLASGWSHIIMMFAITYFLYRRIIKEKRATWSIIRK